MNGTHGNPQIRKLITEKNPAMKNSKDAGPANSWRLYESRPFHQKKPTIIQKT